MLEHRNLKLDLLALGLLALTVFLAAALLSYDPADPPSTLVFPEGTETLNACGRSGATVSRVLFTTVGLGAYYLLLSLGVLDVALLARRAIDQPVLRLSGWLLSLLGFSTLAAMALPGLSAGPVIGSGGYLGAAGRGLLEMNFASIGAYILTVSLILGGLLLCTDYVLLRVVAWVALGPVRGLGRGVLFATVAYAHKTTRKRTDLDSGEEENADEEEKDQDQDEPALRITGRAVEEEDEPQSSGKSDSNKGKARGKKNEKAAARTARKSLASVLRLKKPAGTEQREALEEMEADDNAADYELPGTEMLLPSESFAFEGHEKEIRRKAKILEKTFADFGFNIRVVEVQTGPVIAQFEVELEAGLRLSRITGLADDLAIALRVPSVRIVAPIPGKNTVGVEVPNSERLLVRLREVIEESGVRSSKMRIPIFLGKDVSGNPMLVDLASLPHLLIAGRTGTGKSVCLNSIIASILMTRRPDEVRLLLIDPKMVELSPYKRLPHLMHPVVTDMRKAEAILAWAVEKMDERYRLLARAGVRHISVYNQLGEEELMERMQPEDEEDRQRIPLQIPYVVMVVDEMADLMMTAAKEVEGHIIRLAQKSRAVGIHLVMATQKPTVDIITGLIKSNLPARICFQVASRTDSRVVLDEMGADKLLGNGDMLFLWPGTSTLIRGQGTYLSDDEISGIIAAVATSEPQYVKELVQLKPGQGETEGPQLSNRDDLYEAAVDVVVREGRGSVSLLQRTLGIGYGRAARLIDYMAEDGIVGAYNGSQAREVLLSLEDWDKTGDQVADGEPEAQTSRHPNKILLKPPAKEDDFEGEEEEEDEEEEEGEDHGEEIEEGDFDAYDEDQDEEEDDEEPTDEDEEEEASEDDELDDDKPEDGEHPQAIKKRRTADRFPVRAPSAAAVSPPG